VNLRGTANSAASAVNPNVAAQIRRSSGYAIGAGARQVPVYSAAEDVFAQLQALDGKDLQQISGLNIQGEVKALFVHGIVKGASRPDGTGGDLVQIGSQAWLVVMVLEGWSGWTKAAVVRQAA